VRLVLIFSDKTMELLQKALNVASLRQDVLAHNIANVNTPGFKRSFVSFEESLQQALSSKDKMEITASRPGHLKGRKQLEDVKPQVRTDNSTSLREDGNNVNIDVEMVQLAANSINYQAAINRLNGKISTLRYVINEGRR
jgi:flagellar basal-body rod protein FlgB